MRENAKHVQADIERVLGLLIRLRTTYNFCGNCGVGDESKIFIGEAGHGATLRLPDR